LIGDLDRPEFQGVGEFLESLGQVHRFLEADTAASVLAAGEIVSDLTVIVQSFPGEFSQEVIDRLRAASPVSRMIALLGSWCEGEMRSGQPWPTVIRLYWHQGLGRIGREIRRLARGDCPQWGLPLTATEEERLLAATPRSRTGSRPVAGRTGFQPVETNGKSAFHEGLIGIAARRYESFDWLAAACRLRDYATLWLRGPQYPLVEGFSAILVDGTDFHAAEFEDLRQIALRYPQALRIAIMDFPRIEDHRRLYEAGAAAVFSKPLSVEDLFEEVLAGS
jgi:CheY-like chemotaxis protein